MAAQVAILGSLHGMVGCGRCAAVLPLASSSNNIQCSGVNVPEPKLEPARTGTPYVAVRDGPLRCLCAVPARPARDSTKGGQKAEWKRLNQQCQEIV